MAHRAGWGRNPPPRESRHAAGPNPRGQLTPASNATVVATTTIDRVIERVTRDSDRRWCDADEVDKHAAALVRAPTPSTP